MSKRTTIVQYTAGIAAMVTLALGGAVFTADAARKAESKTGDTTLRLANNQLPPRGAPIDAPVEAEPKPAGKQDPAAPADTLRRIPESSVQLLHEVDTPKFGDDHKFVFEKTKNDKYYKVSLSQLGGYYYEEPWWEDLRDAEDPMEVVGDQIPEEIKELDGEQAVIIGFMVPMEIDKRGELKSFALTQNVDFCHFGIPPSINEWIMVEMEELSTAPYDPFLPMAVIGTLDIGEEFQDGFLASIYRMKGLEVINLKTLAKRAESKDGI